MRAARTCGIKADLFRPNAEAAPTGDDGAPFVHAAGAADGELLLAEALKSGHQAGVAAAKGIGHGKRAGAAPKAVSTNEGPILPV